jgi:hypothetical protein
VFFHFLLVVFERKWLLDLMPDTTGAHLQFGRRIDRNNRRVEHYWDKELHQIDSRIRHASANQSSCHLLPDSVFLNSSLTKKAKTICEVHLHFKTTIFNLHYNLYAALEIYLLSNSTKNNYP